MNTDSMGVDITGLQADIYGVTGSVADIYNRLEVMPTTEYMDWKVDTVSDRISVCEEQIAELKARITREILEEVARRFRDYFDTVQDPRSDEEFYKDLQELLFG